MNCDESIKAVTHAVHASIFSTFSESKGRAIPRLDCIRLRQYDTLHNIATAPLDPLDGTTTLRQAGIKRTHPLWLEIRNEGQAFSTWTKDTVAISVRLFNTAGTKDAMYHEPVQIDIENLSQATVGNLRASIALELAIPGGAQRCRMIVPHAVAQANEKLGIASSLACTSHTRSTSRHKILYDDSEYLGVTVPDDSERASACLGFVQGTEILVEECDDFSVPVDESSSNILRELGLAAASVTLKFNVPGEDKPSMELSIDSRLTLLELKQAIASHEKMLEYGMNSPALFKIRRTANSEEWKDLTVSMTSQGLRDKSSIFIEKGYHFCPHKSQ